MTEPKLKLIEDKGLVCLNIRHGSRMAVFPIAAQDEDGNLWIRYQSDPTDPHYQMDPELRPMWENGKNGSVTLVVHKSQLDVITEYGSWKHTESGEDGTTYSDGEVFNAYMSDSMNRQMMCNICGKSGPEGVYSHGHIAPQKGYFGPVGPFCEDCVKALADRIETGI